MYGRRRKFRRLTRIYDWRLTIMDEQILTVVTNFWQSFSFNKLYETGWAETIQYSGATKADTREDLLISCAFLSGAAQVVTLTQPYMSRQWQVAHQISVCAKILVNYLKVADSATNMSEVVQEVTTKARKNLLDILDTEIDNTIA
jgi:hypothetical protein